jgi:ubiquinone/menaquinone biosynthesis C-methylase UbiE
MTTTKAAVARQFDRTSRAYLESAGHSKGLDIQIVLRLLEPLPDMRVLDVATGAGHTAVAVAPLVSEVVAIDLSKEMIERTKELVATKGLTNLDATVMDVEQLSFPNGSFDAVTCRIAPHHFVDFRRSIAEIVRVLKSGGRFVVEDSCVPQDAELDVFMNDVERLRDPTHVRSYTEKEWKNALVDAGMIVRRVEYFRKQHDIAEWVGRSALDEAGVVVVQKAFRAASAKAQTYFEVRLFDGLASSFTDDKIIIRSDKA